VNGDFGAVGSTPEALENQEKVEMLVQLIGPSASARCDSEARTSSAHSSSSSASSKTPSTTTNSPSGAPMTRTNSPQAQIPTSSPGTPPTTTASIESSAWNQH
jgi:hypothetical protein